MFVMYNSMYVAGGQTQDMFMSVQIIIISQKDLFLSARVIKRHINLNLIQFPSVSLYTVTVKKISS